MIYAGFLLSLVWVWGTVTFQLSGFYYTPEKATSDIGLSWPVQSQGLPFWLSKEVSKSVQVLFNGAEAVLILSLLTESEPCMMHCSCGLSSTYSASFQRLKG